jgi:hypothetical protein
MLLALWMKAPLAVSGSALSGYRDRGGDVQAQIYDHPGSWPKADIDQLKRLARDNVPIWIISVTFGRSAEEIRAKAEEEGISLP